MRADAGHHGAADTHRVPGTEDDLVLDFSGLEELDVRSLALLLTARELACAEDRDVWSTGVPLQTRWALSALGLDDLFPPLPAVGRSDA